MLSLGLLSAGEKAEIVAVRELAVAGANCECRIEDMGLRVGKTIEMLSNGGGAILLRVDESRIAIGRGMAMKIMVRRQ
ncbi:FeoA family protein [Geobacter sp. DSM 9736]|uniref:FeoA family protein n=1 Tax=Geobacter sp. DSM 9736 TaxID=1277350 RepID=UPI000B507FBD|nr:FeoA family protein [Geobacter sp. DSM 9736]SNB44761.1 ferrous iron transport protein A [Geobacter sp. DSM 9736]